MYGLSNGRNILTSDDFERLMVKVKPLKLWSQLSSKRYDMEEKCQQKIDKKSSKSFRMAQ